MKNIKSLKVKVIAVAMASLCAVSVLGAVAVSANDGMEKYESQSISYQNRYNTPFEYRCYGATSYGYDWTYSIDSLNVSVDCDYNFSNNQYTFHVTGVKEGSVNVVLMYVNAQEEWVRVPMKLYVDSHLNVVRMSDVQENKKQEVSRYDRLKNIIQSDNVFSYTVVKTHDDDYYKLVTVSEDEYDILHYEFYRIEKDGVTKLGRYTVNGISCYIDYETNRLGFARIGEDGCCYSGKVTAKNEGIFVNWQNDGYVYNIKTMLKHGSELIFTDNANLSLIANF